MIRLRASVLSLALMAATALPASAQGFGYGGFGLGGGGGLGCGGFGGFGFGGGGGLGYGGFGGLGFGGGGGLGYGGFGGLGYGGFGGLGFGGLGYGGFGGIGYGGFGYGGFGYPPYGYNAPGLLAYGLPGIFPYGGYATAYGFGSANPLFGLGLSPLSTQVALGERMLRGGGVVGGGDAGPVVFTVPGNSRGYQIIIQPTPDPAIVTPGTTSSTTVAPVPADASPRSPESRDEPGTSNGTARSKDPS